MSVLSRMRGVHRLVARLMCGSGLWVMEAVRLRIQDVDFSEPCLFVRETKGDKRHRSTPMWWGPISVGSVVRWIASEVAGAWHQTQKSPNHQGRPGQGLALGSSATERVFLTRR